MVKHGKVMLPAQLVGSLEVPTSLHHAVGLLLWACWQSAVGFLGDIANKFRRPNILQLNIKGLTASKMNVLHHLAMQSKALVILLQETHCTDAEKLVLSNYQLARSSLSRKHGLVTFVHE